jgi:hypothetical protein
VEESTKKTLATKLAKVLGEVSRIPKSGRNKFQNYDYATESDALDAIRPLLSKHNIAVFFDCLSVEELDNNRTRVQIQVEMVCGDSGESRSSICFGEARDADNKGKTQDKGLYKAMTGAMKYWMFKTFMISTGDDPETDHGNEPYSANTSRSSVKPASKKAATHPSAPAQAQNEFAAQAKDLCQYAKQNGLEVDDIKDICSDNNLPDHSSKFTSQAQVVALGEAIENKLNPAQTVGAEVA